jgi:hypothetical protein
MSRLKQFDVVLTYNTYASSPEEAIDLAVEAISARSSAYVEVLQGNTHVTEGELGAYLPEEER